MLALRLPHLLVSLGPTGTMLLAGGLTTGLVFLAGRLWLGRKPARRPLMLRAPVPVDPFVSGSHTERRGSVRRHGNPVPTLVAEVGATDRPWPAWVLDRSLGGLRLCMERPLEPGTVLCVRAVHAPRTVPWVEVEVRHCQMGGDCWETGCRFLRTPPWSVLLLFG